MSTKPAEAKKENKKYSKEYTFEWEGKDSKGKEIKGQMKAAAESAVKVHLRGKGIKVSKVKKRGKNLSGASIKQADIAILTRQLSTMMRAGVPLVQSFDIVATSSVNPRITHLLNDIKNDIESGSNLEQAFAKHPKFFDNLYCSLIAAGEDAGILDDILDRLALYQEKMTAIKKKIKSALTYPIAIW